MTRLHPAFIDIEATWWGQSADTADSPDLGLRNESAFCMDMAHVDTFEFYMQSLSVAANIWEECGHPRPSHLD